MSLRPAMSLNDLRGWGGSDGGRSRHPTTWRPACYSETWSLISRPVSLPKTPSYAGEPVRAREIGLRLSVPKDCDRLTWSRKAQWRVYPEDHIGTPADVVRIRGGAAFIFHGCGK